MSKKRKGSHNKQKRIDLVNRRVVKDLSVVFVLNDTNYADVVNLKTKKKINLGPVLDKTIRLEPHHWNLLLAAFCRDGAGEEYIKMLVTRSDRPCLQRELDESASKRHSELIRSCNDSHLIGVGWIATPYECDFPEENDPIYESIFDMYGAWIPARDVLMKEVS